MEGSGGEWRGEKRVQKHLCLWEKQVGEEQDMYGFFRRGVKKPEVARPSISAETRGASGKVHGQVGGLV